MSNAKYKTSQSGLRFVMAAEKTALKAYKDTGGVWTNGTGHTKGVYDGQIITLAQARAWLAEDIAEAEAIVMEAVSSLKYSLLQHQFDMLVSAVFNEGPKIINDKAIYAALKTGDFEGAMVNFIYYVSDNGIIENGLVKRRLMEMRIFLRGYGSMNLAWISKQIK